MSIKNRLIDLIQDSHKITCAFVNGLSEAERNAVGTAQKWSAKDNLAHSTEWIERFCQDLDTARGGGTVSEVVEQIDQANLEIFEQHRQLSWQAISEKVDRAYAALLRQIQAASEEQLQTTQFFAWDNRRPLWQVFAGNACIHPVIHITQVLIQQGHTERANQIMDATVEKLLNLDDSLRWRGLTLYNLACHYSQVGEKGRAIAWLDEALHLYPDVIEWSKKDPNLDPLREEAAYLQLMQALEKV